MSPKALAALGWTGAALLFAWVSLAVGFTPPGWTLWVTGIAGLAALGGWAALERDRLTALALSPRLRVGSNAVVFALALAGVVILLNVIATRHSFRADLTANKFYSLSDQTRKVARGLTRKVKITGFFKKGSEEYLRMKDLIEEYRHLSTQIDVEFVDPDENPAKTQNYKITAYDTTVVESGTRRKDILPQETFSMNYSMPGQQPTREFKGEQVLTTALLSVTQDRQLTVYFLEGHGEHATDDKSQQGIDQLKADLERDNFVVKTLNLLQGGKSGLSMPADADLLIVAGPRKPVPAPEAKVLGDWLAKDGRMLLMVEIDTTAGLDGLLKTWGVTMLSGMVGDQRSYYPFGGPMLPVPTYRSHKITDDLQRAAVPVMLLGPRAIKTTDVAGLRIDPLLETTADGFIKADWRSQKEFKFAKGVDKTGAFTLAVAVSRSPKSVPQGPDASGAPPADEPKLVVFGNAQWVGNSIRQVMGGNFDLFANAVNWLAGTNSAISVRPRDPDQRRLVLDNTRASLMWYLAVILTPLAALGAGVAVWWRRRSL